MFYHSKELQFKARVSRPDPRFARLLLEQFGGGNGEISLSNPNDPLNCGIEIIVPATTPIRTNTTC